MINRLIIIMLSVGTVGGTVDIDMPEIKYLADHLHPEECRRLVAVLHFKSYNVPNVLDEAEENVSQDIPCLRLLLHWNSAEEEGKGETHEVLFRRLRQIGRDDLAEWLGRTVFQELGQDLRLSLNEPFKEFLSENPEFISNISTSAPLLTREEQFAWLPFDTICWSLILTLVIITFVMLTRLIVLNCKNIRYKKKTVNLKNRVGKYEKMENQSIISESESEDKFDIRKKDDPALKLMGV